MHCGVSYPLTSEKKTIDLQWEKCCEHFSAFIFNLIVFIIADNKDPYKLICIVESGVSILAHLNRRLKVSLYYTNRAVVCCVSVDIFKLKYLRNQCANRNEILTEPSLGWGKGCIRFWARSDRNSGVHGNG